MTDYQITDRPHNLFIASAKSTPVAKTAKLIRLGLLLCLVPTLVACQPPKAQKQQTEQSASNSGKNDIDAPPTKTTTLAVQSTISKRGTLSVQRSTNATIKAGRDSAVVPLVGGVVRQVLVKEGQQVVRGQVLMLLDDTTQRQALENAKQQLKQASASLNQLRNNAAQNDLALQSAVEAARSALNTATQNKQSAEQLYQLGGTSWAELQSAKQQYAQAQSNLTQAENNLRQNGRSNQNSIPLQRVQVKGAQIALRQAKQNLERTQLKAPFGGTIAKINLEEGEFATQSSPALRLIDPRSISAEFSVPSNDAANLPVGKVVRLRYSGQRYRAEVAENSGVADQSRLATLSVRLLESADLPVGATARITYRRILGTGTIIPSEAVQANTGQNVVYTINKLTVSRKYVRVLAESAGQMVVSGLAADQQIVSPALASLQDGMGVSLSVNSASSSESKSQGGEQ